MRISDWLVPGRRRRRLSQSIDGVADIARSRAGSERLVQDRARLWWMLCEAGRQTMQQLLVKSTDRRMDWGLKKHAGRIDDARLVTMFWWMLLYQIVVFRNRGLVGYAPEDEVGPMYEVARRFAEAEFARLGLGFQPIGPWADNWRRHVPLESAMAFYNSTHDLLQVRNDLTVRITHVSHFTTLTEQAYDRLVEDTFS